MKRSLSSKRKVAFFPVLAIVSLGMLAGCELLVDFDRTKIDGGSLGDVDGSFSDVVVPVGDGASNDGQTPTDGGDAGTDGSTTTDSGDAAITDAGDAEVDADI